MYSNQINVLKPAVRQIKNVPVDLQGISSLFIACHVFRILRLIYALILPVAKFSLNCMFPIFFRLHFNYLRVKTLNWQSPVTNLKGTFYFPCLLFRTQAKFTCDALFFKQHLTLRQFGERHSLKWSIETCQQFFLSRRNYLTW